MVVPMEQFTRKGSLARLGGLLVAAAGGEALLGDTPSGNAAIETGAVQCVLTPELTEGPYYIAGEKAAATFARATPARR